jgi:hypothetical protein
MVLIEGFDDASVYVCAGGGPDGLGGGGVHGEGFFQLGYWPGDGGAWVTTGFISFSGSLQPGGGCTDYVSVNCIGGLAANNTPNKVGCFVKGLKNGATGAVIVAGATIIASTVLAPEVVTGGLLLAAGYGTAKLASSVWNNFHNGNQAGLAYNAGSVLGGIVVGGATAYPTRYAITGETNLPTGIGDFFGAGKGIYVNPGQSVWSAVRAAFAKGPDLGGAGLATGIAGGAVSTGCN